MLRNFPFSIFNFQLKYAGVVELVDSTDLGAVTSVKEWIIENGKWKIEVSAARMIGLWRM